MRCAVEVAALRAKPREGAEQVTQALRGDPLAVAESAGAWAYVETVYGYPGWIRTDELCGDDPLSLARTFVGSPYEWGGMTASGLDCSGLVHIAYRLTGKTVPRDAWQQEAAGAAVEVAEPGDLVTYGADRADHIAFWVGGGRVLHATARDGLGVVEESEPADLRDRRRALIRL